MGLTSEYVNDNQIKWLKSIQKKRNEQTKKNGKSSSLRYGWILENPVVGSGPEE